MANVIKVETSKLRSAASQFSSTSTQIKNATNAMTQAVNQLNGAVWSGDAASSYIKQFTGLNDEITKIDKMLQEHIQDLQDIAAEYDRTENENRQTAGSLSNNIF